MNKIKENVLQLFKLVWKPFSLGINSNSVFRTVILDDLEMT